MPIYQAPVEDVKFLLNDVFQIERYSNLPGFADASPDMVEAVSSRRDTIAVSVPQHLEKALVERHAVLPGGDWEWFHTTVAPALQIEHTNVKGESRWSPTRHELWKWLLALGLGVLLFEWYIYNRRVYL